MKPSFKLKYCVVACLSMLLIIGCSTKKIITPTITDVRVVDREVSMVGKSLNLNEAEGDGMAILKNVSFTNGTISLDIRGENNPGQSFVGIAFNIENDTTFEAIYFRPFNFESPDQIRREHSVQYIYSPDYPWDRLRKEHEGKFEAEYFDPPAPDDWFSLSLTIEKDKVIVKDGDSGKLILQTKRLSSASSDKIGFWVGNNSKGSFRNLRIQ